MQFEALSTVVQASPPTSAPKSTLHPLVELIANGCHTAFSNHKIEMLRLRRTTCFKPAEILYARAPEEPTFVAMQPDAINTGTSIVLPAFKALWQ